MVLTPKNVQAYRTLFNVAHRLAEKLDTSWVIILTTLATLDHTLCSPSTTTQQVSQTTAGTSGPPRASSGAPAGAAFSGASGAGNGAYFGAGSGAFSGAGNAGGGAFFGAGNSSSLDPNSDLQILSAAANQLFQSTAYMSDGAVLHIVSALERITLDAGKPVEVRGPRAASLPSLLFFCFLCR